MKKILILLILMVLTSILTKAQESAGFRKPSSPILQLADYSRPPRISMDLQRQYILLQYSATYKTLADLSQPELKLAGMRINPDLFCPSQLTYINALKLRTVQDTQLYQIQGMPASPKLAYITWSPDYKKIAFTHTDSAGMQLWIADIEKRNAYKVCSEYLNAAMGQPFIWFTDSKSLLIKAIPQPRPIINIARQNQSLSPAISTAQGISSQNRTYPDLLRTPADEDLFMLLCSSELLKVNLQGSIAPFGPIALYNGMSFSPDGNYILLSQITKPFSYLVPVQRFPMIQSIYSKQGTPIIIANKIPLNEIMPKGFSAVRTGKRELSWRSDKPATLCFVQALDAGDPASKVEYRDEIFCWDAPFDKDPIHIARTALRFADIQWCNDTLALLYESWYDSRTMRIHRIFPGQPQRNSILIHQRNYQDKYADPGNFSERKNEYGKQILDLSKDNLFLIGSGISEQGQFPFIDQMNINTLQKRRLYQFSGKGIKEDILSLEDINKGIALVQLQSPRDYPDYYFRNFMDSSAALQRITYTINPFAELGKAYKKVLRYKRNDGLELSGTLYLPPGYDTIKKEKLPLLLWAYPQEFKNRNTASQIINDANEFTFPGISSFIHWVMKGYAVLDDAAFPIVGEDDKEPNDTFISQLIANGRAAIDAVDALGYIDRKRVAVGGHSYGAFMTANLLTHSDDFACGIARSGAYNRTLTPFGFQGEQRNFWDAPDIYNAMSPFVHAHKMKKPILLIHGDADNNPGTFTLQTERYFQAIKGLGGTARMVLLPRESHSYAARENILHMLWEQEQFLDTYLAKP